MATIEKERIQQRLEQVQKLSLRLQSAMDQYDTIAKNIAAYEQALANRSFDIMPVAQDVLKQINQNPVVFLRNKATIIKMLKEENPDFAARVSKIKVPNPQELEVLKPLFRYIEYYKRSTTQKDKDVLVRYLVSNKASYVARLVYFEDKELAEKVGLALETLSGKRLNELKVYLQGLLEMVRRGEQEKDWRDFNAFWSNIDGEIRKVREEYRNELVAKYMEEGKRRLREYPQAWKQRLARLLAILKSPAYVNKENESIIDQLEKPIQNRIIAVRGWDNSLKTRYKALLKRSIMFKMFMLKVEVIRKFMKRWNKLKQRMVEFDIESEDTIKRLLRLPQIREIRQLSQVGGRIDEILLKSLNQDERYTGWVAQYLFSLSAYGDRIAHSIDRKEMEIIDYTQNDINQFNRIIQSITGFMDEMKKITDFLFQKTKEYQVRLNIETR